VAAVKGDYKIVAAAAKAIFKAIFKARLVSSRAVEWFG
jgi:hypothetical protein